MIESSNEEDDNKNHRLIARKKINVVMEKSKKILAQKTISTPEQDKQKDLSPHTIGQVAKINQLEGQFIFKVLFDLGATVNMIKKLALPHGIKLYELDKAHGIQTMLGSMNVHYYVALETLAFPEFLPNRYVPKTQALVFNDDKVRYDLIVGQGTMKDMELKLDFSSSTMDWLGKQVPFHPVDWFSNKAAIHQVLAMPPVRVQLAEVYSSEFIRPAKYEKANLHEVVDKQTHLSEEQRQDLLEVFMKHKALFSGKVGRFPRDFHLDVDPEAVPFYQLRPYPLNSQHLEVLKGELDRQEALGIIKKCHVATHWCLPMFCHAKKDGIIHTVHDFWPLNRAIRRKIYMMPRIQDILFGTREYWFLMKTDISMQYYAFWLDEESTWYCVFITLFGKYRLMRLAMGCIQSADYVQAAMEEVFHDLREEVVVYMDDLKSQHIEWSDHIKMIDEMLRHLLEYGFMVNPLKCEWGIQETDFLGYHLTPKGPKPWSKRIEPILCMEEPKTLTELCGFIGMVNFYQSMFKKRAEVLAPLTSMTKISPLQFKKEWGPKQKEAFQSAKAMVASQTLLWWPDLNKQFVIETNASDYQLGAVIKQEDQPIAFYSCKLTGPQQKYSTIEKELLAILEVLEEY
jgi:hypothetical protein